MGVIMKKIFKMMAVPLLVLLMVVPILANGPSIIISNEKLPVSAVSKEGRVLVPLRAIFESLGATVAWDSSTNTITGNQNGKIIILKINDKVASVDGQSVILDVPATIIKGSTLVPVRFIGESLGAKVEWINNTVLINSDNDIAVQPVKPNNTSGVNLPTENSKFVGSVKSDKYHFIGYTHRGPILDKNAIYFDSKEDAIQHGYGPCGLCFK